MIAMSQNKFYSFIFAPLLIVVLNNGVSVSTDVQTSGNSKVSVEQKVESSQQSSVSVYKKMEINVNGNKKTLETTESGTHVLNYDSNNATASAKSTVSNTTNTNKALEKIDFTKNQSTMTQYIVSKIREFFESLFSGLRKSS